ncbi:MAG: potassium transporter [Desulfobulbus propionicus]|nr:MAG: potassium transporter [Desulfobulbus propionicus]PIE63927.1 MAG: potassium transporter [Desulfobacterales bacterium]
MKPSLTATALGHILIGFGVIILSPVIVALLDKDFGSILPFCVASVCSIVAGYGLRRRGGWQSSVEKAKRTQVLLLVSLTWVTTAAIGALPYLFYGLHPIDAYFESVSGITTTGATILLDFSLYPKAFYFWRSLTQWLGGMGIIVLFVAILPQFAVVGRQMFFAEAPGPTEEKITPRIANTAKALWFIYVLLTTVEIILLYSVGLPVFDAVCNGLTTMAAGGFSPHPQSIMGYQNSAVTWIITAFMFLAGSNFALQYRFLIQLKPKSLVRSEEFRLYCGIILGVAAILTGVLWLGQKIPLAESIRDSLFQVVSIITTAGFSSADFALWTVPAQALLLIVMFVGGCAGSAGGGIKVVRVLFMGKYLFREVVQALHPKAVVPIKIDRQTVPDSIAYQMLGFLLFYLLLFFVSGVLVTMIEGSFSTGFVGAAATIGNIGPGFGEIGPMGTFGNLTIPSKLICILNMVVGRLELIPFMVMFHPDFWRR